MSIAESPVRADPEQDQSTAVATPWVVLVWDDPINLITYVCKVLQKLFNYSEAEAMKLTMQVHKDGKAVVANGTKEKCEMDVFRLHEYGLWATMQNDS